MTHLSNNLFTAAAYFVVKEKYCSKCSLQRRLSIGYEKACEIIEFLLDLGLIYETGVITYGVTISDISIVEEVLDDYYQS